MKIKNISCTQFAGVRDRDIRLDSGINVIYGKNESGKSTLVNLISRILFQSAKIDKRKDKEFIDLYFPTASKGGVVGDFVDGKIVIEAENGIYTLSKEWGGDSRCTLSTPDGVIRDQNTIDEILKEILTYGEGVYSDMLFSSQRNTDVSLQTLLDASKKTEAKQELMDVVSQAFAESGGISADVIEQAISAKIEEIGGKHWDTERGMPDRKAGGGRHQKQIGRILEAYYALEDAQAELNEISRLENEAERIAQDYKQKDAAVCVAEETFNKFNTFAGTLALQAERKKAVERLSKDMAKIDEVLSFWPTLAENLEKARKLKIEKTNRSVLDVYAVAKQNADEIAAVQAQIADLACPTDSEIMQVRNAQRKQSTLENKLCGMNLNASITMFGGNSIKITSLRTGEDVDVSAGIASITEAVRITIPDVMEMQLTPADVNVTDIEAQIASQKNIADEIFKKYDADSIESLEKLAKNFEQRNNELKDCRRRLDMLLGTISFSDLEAAATAVTDPVRAAEEIEREILIVCGGNSDVDRFITAKETIVQGYVAEYGSVNDLKAKAFDISTELQKARESVTSADNIPVEYLSISNPEAHREALQSELKLKQSQREAALTAKTAAASRLETFKGSIVGDPVEKVGRAKRRFDEQQELLNHWLRIRQVFNTQKEAISNNPMQDIADSFAKYLGIISGGRVESEFPEADKLNMNIYSGNKLIDYGKLSEGTKETVSLAFRLAVLDHLFPDGGGVIVFDDPFTDMDADRTAQSCELIKQCATRHQVIFLTCNEDYLKALGGTSIIF